MNVALKIARREFQSLFFSPVAWVLLIVFVLQVSIDYVALLTEITRWIFAGSEPAISRVIFSRDDGLVGSLFGALMFYVPILSMGAMSREYQNGSIKLLMSSPATVSQIVFGKYLALLAYLLLLTAWLLGIAAVSFFVVEHFEFPRALSAILGAFLLAATYAAVGLFMSSLTVHQMVAAVTTIALLAALSFIGEVGQRVPLLGDLAYWLSIDGRSEYLRDGLIASRDVLYFLSIIAMFLVFTQLRLSNGMRTEPGWVRAARYTGTVLVVSVLGHFTSQPQWSLYLDTTRNKEMSLSSVSTEVLAHIEGSVGMTVYVNALDPGAHLFLPARRNSLHRHLLEKHERGLGRINARYQFYYADAENERLYSANPGKSNKDLAREFARQNVLDFDDFMDQQQIDEVIALDGEPYRNFYMLEWRGRRSILRNFDDFTYYPAERTISAALKRLAIGPKVVAYVTDAQMRRPFRRAAEDHRDYVGDGAIRSALANHGFDFRELSLDRSVPEDVDVLMLAGPAVALTETQLKHLQAAVEAGVNLIVLGEPATPVAVREVLADFGVSLVGEELVEPKDDYSERRIFSKLASGAAGSSFAMPAWNPDGPVVLPGASGLSLFRNGEKAGFRVDVILETDPGLAVQSASNGIPVPLGAVLERPLGHTTQRIVVIGDADFMSSDTWNFSTPRDKNNLHFVSDLFAYVSHGEYPLDIPQKFPIDTTLALDLRQVNYLKVALYGVIPGTIFLFGAAFLLRRRRR